MSRGWSRPAPAAAEQTRKATVESSKIGWLSLFTASQAIREKTRKRRGWGPALVYQRKQQADKLKS
jgi:hypothetical protein